MPALSVPDVTALTRLTLSTEPTVDRPVISVTTASRDVEGAGFPVYRGFNGMHTVHTDPFVLLDQAGPVNNGPFETKGAPWHPHRGFETVTYLMDGGIVHKDSNGGGGIIHEGDTQWMTAGAGVLHDELPTEEVFNAGGHAARHPALGESAGVPQMDSAALPDRQSGQLRVARQPGCWRLRATHRRRDRRSLRSWLHPHPHHVGARDRSPPARRSRSPGTRRIRRWSTSSTARARSASTGTPSRRTRRRCSAKVTRSRLAPRAHSSPRPVRSRSSFWAAGRSAKPSLHYGPFVMNTEAEIRQAVEDFEAGRLGTIPADVL